MGSTWAFDPYMFISFNIHKSLSSILLFTFQRP